MLKSVVVTSASVKKSRHLPLTRKNPSALCWPFYQRGPAALSVEALREAVPNEYRLWVRSAVLVGVLAYFVVTVMVALGDGFGAIYLRQESYALLLSLLGLALERKGKAQSAAYLVLFAATAEILVSFYRSPDGLSAAALPGLPVIVMVSGLFLGPRGAYFLGGTTGVLVPLLVWLSGQQGVGPGFGPRAGIGVAALLVSQLATAAVLHVFLLSFGRLLGRATRNERRAAELLEAAPDGLLVVGPDGRIEACNDKAVEALGMQRKALDGLYPEALPLLPVDRESGRFVLSEVTEETLPIEYRATNTGTALEARARKVSSSDERASWLVLLRDITARLDAKKREEELSAQLQHSQKLEAIGQLAGGVAHDFNNLLTVVAGYSDFIEDLPEENAQEIAEELRATCQRGVVLTRQLLAFARREVTTPIPLDVSATVHGLRNLLGRLLGEHIRIDLSADEVCPIKADAGQIEQVVLNLAANARDAMPQGGTLRLRVFGQGDRVVLEVEDTGVGIDDATQRRIFEPFFTTKPRGKGTGLGLSTVHGIVTQAEGRISVASRKGQGARFQISWPRTNEALPGEPQTSQIARPKRGEGLILLAEDDKRARKLIVRMLSDAGFEVLAAQDGAEALSLAVNLDRSPDLLLTDIVMPGMSGVELIERVQRMHPTVRFLLMSGYTDQQLAPARFDLSVDLLPKPFGRRELLDRVAAKVGVLDRKRA